MTTFATLRPHIHYGFEVSDTFKFYIEQNVCPKEKDTIDVDRVPYNVLGVSRAYEKRETDQGLYLMEVTLTKI